MNWPIFSPNFARGGAGFSRMARSGNRHAAISESPTKSAVIISRFRQGDTHRALFIGALIADRNFRASAGYAEPLRAWPVAGPTTVVNSTGGFGCDWCGRDSATSPDAAARLP